MATLRTVIAANFQSDQAKEWTEAAFGSGQRSARNYTFERKARALSGSAEKSSLCCSCRPPERDSACDRAGPLSHPMTVIARPDDPLAVIGAAGDLADVMPPHDDRVFAGIGSLRRMALISEMPSSADAILTTAPQFEGEAFDMPRLVDRME